MGGQRTAGLPLGSLIGLAVALMASFLMVALSDVETKFKLAAIMAIAGFAVLTAYPDRRDSCIVLCLLIHPLRIEKIFYLNAAEGPQFTDPSMPINVSDGPLVLLALFLFAETMFSNRVAFRWSRLTTILLMFLVWSAI